MKRFYQLIKRVKLMDIQKMRDDFSYEMMEVYADRDQYSIGKIIDLAKEAFDKVVNKKCFISCCFVMCESWFHRETQPCGNIIRIAECPNCGDVVVYNYGCAKCNADFVFK